MRATMPPATSAPVTAPITTPARNRRPGPAVPARGREGRTAGGTGCWGSGNGGWSAGGAGGVAGGPQKAGPSWPERGGRGGGAVGIWSAHIVGGISAIGVFLLIGPAPGLHAPVSGSAAQASREWRQRFGKDPGPPLASEDGSRRPCRRGALEARGG